MATKSAKKEFRVSSKFSGQATVSTQATDWDDALVQAKQLGPSDFAVPVDEGGWDDYSDYAIQSIYLND